MKRTIIYSLILLSVFSQSACSDFFDQESDNIIFSDKDHLKNATDSIYSMTGILNKLQTLADRTIVLGEVRGDLVSLTNTASSDLRDVAMFNIGDENMYNVPKDYYAVINNCNYFIAHADTTLKNNRNEYIFMKEYAAAKAIRAWTYLQLVLNYGSVPFVTEPILTKEESEAVYPRYNLQAICEYFINDLLPLTDKYGREYPSYGTIRNTDSRFFFFPINIVLGDLNLWLASSTGNTATYKEAALRYYKYISERNGENSTYPVSLSLVTWSPGTTNWNHVSTWSSLNVNEAYGTSSELITMIPCDSIRSEGNYSELRNLFNSTDENNYKMSITPSNRIITLSESQMHCVLGNSGTTTIYAPTGLSNHRSGDLRLSQFFNEGYSYDKTTDERIETQYISKYNSRNVHIYRRQMIYLRMAEALNMAGYPRVAYQILSTGLNSDVMQEYVYPHCSESDSLFLSQFDFPAARYGLMTSEMLVNNLTVGNVNTIGIHTRGSGWTPMNEYYQLPEDSLMTETELTPIQQAWVSEKLLDEEALELAFEGTRYYDVMRFALRASNPGQFMADRIYCRQGEENKESVRAEIKVDISNPQNWYMQWNGKIGLEE